MAARACRQNGNSKVDKFAALRAARQNGRREYTVQDEDEGQIYDEVDEDDYRAIVRGRLQKDDFVEDDQDGESGYVDDGREDWDEAERGRESDDDRHAHGKRGKAKKSVVALLAKQPSKTIAPDESKYKEATVSAYRAPVNREQEDDFMAKLMGNIGETAANDVGLALPVSMKRKTSMDRLSYLGGSNLLGRPAAKAVAPVARDSYDIHPASSPASEAPTIMITDTFENGNDVKKVKTEMQDDAIYDDGPMDFDDAHEDIKPLQIRTGKHQKRKTGNVSAAKDIVIKAENHSQMDIVEEPHDSASDWMRYASLSTLAQPPSSDPQQDEVKTSTSVISGSKIAHSTISEESDDTKVRIFWIDHTEQNGVVILFGKVFDKVASRWISCALSVQGIDRNLFLLPRQRRVQDGFTTDLPVSEEDIQEEFDKIRSKCKVNAFASKMVTRKYAFELKDVPAETEYLKVVYPHSDPAIPLDTQGETFSRIFGTQTSAFELLVLKRKILGPCWLELSDIEIVQPNPTWCAVAIQVSSPKSIRAFKDTDNDAPKEAPPFVVMSLSLRTIMNIAEKRLEIVAAAARTYTKFSLDDPTPIEKMPCTLQTFVRPLGGVFPGGFEAAAARSRDRIDCSKVERLLIQNLVQTIAKHDPDVIVGHELSGATLDVLISRMQRHNLENWHRIGRLKQPKGKYPNTRYSSARIFPGRLLCDLNNEGPRGMITSTTWSLTEMCQTHLDIQRPEFDPDDTALYLDSAATTPERMMIFVKQLQADTFFTAAIMSQLQLLPLTRQLTNLAGSAWSSTLTAGGRSERNEFILLHEFHKEKYICPDKLDASQRRAIKAEEDEANEGVGKGKKDKYKGGLVFEPKRGLHDKIVLVMDFNSLYPSIIQEYNICFTTIERNHLTTDENGEESVPNVPSGDTKLGVLPRMIATLVNKRRIVKGLMKDRTCPQAKMLQYDIRQKALKLTANSMYGCLGFRGSRFYARPLAMLTTYKGREILTSTKELAEANNLNVIYGDTDSVMINTNVLDLVEAQRTGNVFKKLVNERYHKLEIDIDAIFQRLLLLQKKKYAALKIEQIGDTVHVEKEIKGLDMKRREFSDLSKDISEFVLGQVLSGEPTERCVENIYEFLAKVGQDIRDGKMPLEKYIINKRLGKNPEEYPDAKSQPHVTVATRMKAKGGTPKMGDVIPYIFCLSADTKSSPAERAYHPDELRRVDSELKIDFNYYLSNQILPPIERLCEPIEGIERPRLAESLGLDPHRYQSHAASDEDMLQMHTFGSQLSDAERFRGAQPPSIKCHVCSSQTPFHGLLDDPMGMITPTAILCGNPDCQKPIPIPSMYAQLLQEIQTNVRAYYEGWLVCNDPSCDQRTLAMGVYGWRCLRPGCKGQMSNEYSDTQLYTQLLYYDSIFDVDRAIEKSVGNTRHEQIKILAEHHRRTFDTRFRQIIKKYLERNGRRYIDMRSLFHFMTLA